MARQDVRGANPGIVPHPAYAAWSPVWQKSLDVYEGSGGFLDTTRPYLRPHPREWLDHSVYSLGRWVSNPTPTNPSPKLKARRAIARYENIAATLIDQLAGALFRKAPQRGFEQEVEEDHPLHEFWENADGTGRGIDAVMHDAWTAAAVFGHIPILGDRVADSGDTQADSSPFMVRLYTPLDLIDWLTDDVGNLTQVRLLEAAPRTSFDQIAGAVTGIVRDVDDTQWTLTQLTKSWKPAKNVEIKSGNHGFGRLPVVVLYARRRPLLPTIGRSVLGDPELYIDLYNLTSEVRELLRNQTFALLNVPLGADGSVEKESALLGETAGTTNVIFSSQPVDYVSPEGTNVQVYHEHIDRLMRTIYRLAVVGWESDSKDAESADSRKLKKEDLHQMLAGYAAECEQTERTLAEFVYRAAFGPDKWQAQWDKDQPIISYPDEFEVTGLLDELEAVTQAMALELGETATRQLKKRVIPRVLPNLPQAIAQQIDDEIDALEVKTQEQKDMQLLQARFGGDPNQADPNQPMDPQRPPTKNGVTEPGNGGPDGGAQ